MLAPMTRGLRGVRRPRTAAALAAGLVLGLTGCAGIGQPAPYDSPGINGLVIPTPTPAPADFVEGVDNPWLALAPGTRWTYDVTEDAGTRGRIDVEVQDGTVPVAGLEATAVQTTTDLGGGDDERRDPPLRPGRGRQRLAGRLGHRRRVLAGR